MNIPNPLAKLEGMTYEQLVARRSDLIAKCQNQPSGLPEDELTELVSIYGILRRHTSPSSTSSKKTATPVDLSVVPADI